LLLVVDAEMIAAGIGFLILSAADLMQTKKLRVGLIALSLPGLSFNWLFLRIEKSSLPWRP
jgi:ABC-type nitrate/sulfonate/bicarbonate transport system permease component